MKTPITARWSSRAVISAAAIAGSGVVALGQTDRADYIHTLADGSRNTSAFCRPNCWCGIGLTFGPLQGELTLRYSHSDDWTTYYDVVRAELSGTLGSDAVRYSGTGTYEIGGDFALSQRIVLNLALLTEAEPTIHTFDSGSVLVDVPSMLPGIAIVATSTGGDECAKRSIEIYTTAVGTPVCASDVGAAGGLPGRDGLLDNNDFVAFLGLFFDAHPSADLGAVGGERASDGLFDNNDFIVFIDLFFAGC